MNRSRRAGLVLAVAVGALAQPRAARAQLPAAFLIAEARRQLDDLNADSAAILLRLALDSRARANRPDSIRALVLLGVTEIMAARQDDARRAFREALALDPDLRVDSLADLHSQLLPVFTSVRSALPAPPAEQRPATPPAQQPQPATPAGRPAVTAAHREGSIELTAGSGLFVVDQALLSQSTGQRLLFGWEVRATYNINRNLGVGVGTSLGTGNGATLNGPFAAVTYTLDLNKKFSPFFELGAGMNRFSGNGMHLTSSYAAFGGVGVRTMIGDNMALRVEGRMAYDKYPELSSAAYNGGAFVGLSYFMGGGPPRDTDGDGVPDKRDLCADTPPGSLVTYYGCPFVVRVR